MKKSEFLKRKIYENKFVWGSFFLAAAVVLSAYIFIGIYPAANISILGIDMHHQYAPFYEEFRNIFANGKSFLYSWDGGMGKSFIPQFAYYSACPLNFITALFPREYISEVMAALILVKISFSASFFAFYLKKKFGRDDFTIVIFSLLYSSSAFITVYYWNIIWLDAVALFPIIALGIESLVKEKKYKMYCIALAYVIFSNFYIAFIVCVFSAVYFAAAIFCAYTWKTDKKIMLDRLVRFALLSFLSAGVCAVLIIPAANALSLTNAAGDSGFPEFAVYNNVYQLITDHLIGARPVILELNNGAPNIYSGLLTIILIPFYYFSKNINKREKIIYSAFLIFMLLCCCVNTLDFIVHGFHFTANIPHRFTFVYSFVIIAMAYNAFINMQYAENKKGCFIFLGIIAAAAVIPEFLIEPFDFGIKRNVENYEFVINLAAAAVYIAIILRILNNKKNRARPLALLSAIVFAEALFSTFGGINYIVSLKPLDRNSYIGSMDGIDRAMAYADKNDGKDFYRMDINRIEAVNESSLYHYKAYATFSSVAYGAASKLMENIGVTATSNSYRLGDAPPFICSLFNIKYIIDKNNTDVGGLYYDDSPKQFFIGTKEQEEVIEKIKAYLKEKTGDSSLEQIFDPQLKDKDEIEKTIKEIAGVKSISSIPGINPGVSGDFIRVYENPYVFPLGFIVNKNKEDVKTLEEIKNIYSRKLEEITSPGEAVRFAGDAAKDLSAYVKMKKDGAFGIEDWITDCGNPFDVQNNFAYSAAGIKEKMFNEVPFVNIQGSSVFEDGEKVELIKLADPENKDGEPIDIKTYMDKYGAKNKIDYVLTKPNNMENAYIPEITLEFEAKKTGRTYIYVNQTNASKGRYFVISPDGASRQITNADLATGVGVIDAGTVKKGSKISIELELTKKAQDAKKYRVSGPIKIYAATFEDDVFKKVYNEIIKNPMTVSDYGDDYINAEVNTQKDGFLFTSIPYDDGWTVLLDGTEAEKISFGENGLLGLYVPAGSHTLEFSFYTVGLNLGIIISFISLLLLLAYGLYDKKNNRAE